MKKLSNRDWAILIVAAICFGAIGFAVKGLFTPVPTPSFIGPDNSKQNRSIDSLIKLKEASDRELFVLKRQLDSILILKTKNHKRLSNEINIIKKFTPSSRDKWNDSVLRANSIR